MTFTMILDRETKNSVRYIHTELGTVYVPKRVLMRLGEGSGSVHGDWPTALEVTMRLPDSVNVG